MPFDIQTFGNKIISQYLYGTGSAPASLSVVAAEELIARRARARSLDEDGRGSVSLTDIDYMSVAGRYTTIGQSVLVQRFFATNLSHMLALR